MFSWPALVLAPTIALANLSIVYALVTPSCAGQTHTALHAVAAISVLAVLALTALAWQAWRRVLRGAGLGRPEGRPRLRSVTAADGDAAAERANFMGLVGARRRLVAAGLHRALATDLDAVAVLLTRVPCGEATVATSRRWRARAPRAASARTRSRTAKS
jgi:hypothetical protein